MTIAAVFDCDGTLFTAQFGRGLLKYAAENGWKDNARAYYSTLLVPHILRKFRLISKKRYHHPLIANMGKIIKDWNETEALRCFEWVVNKYLLPTEQVEVVDRLSDHRRKGHHLVLVSGIMLPALEILKEHYGADQIIGTVPEVIQGTYTGEIIPPVIMGEQKAEKTLELLAQVNEPVDWQSSYSYADTIMDRHVLSLSGHPIAVNPDRKLYQLATKKGWEVIGTVKDS